MTFPRHTDPTGGYNSGYMQDLELPKRRYRVTRRRHWTGSRTVTSDQIRQGSTAICYLLAPAVGNLTYRTQVNTKTGKITRYEFLFRDERGVKNRVRVTRNGRFTNMVADAYAKVRPHQDIYNSGFEWNALSDITGHRVHAVLPDTVDELLNQADKGETLASLGTSDLLNPLGWVRNHAYAIHSVSDEHLTLYNPWSSDGVGPAKDGVNDGFVTFTRSELQQSLDSGVALRLSNVV